MTISDLAELVEAPSFLTTALRADRRFDRLSEVGFGRGRSAVTEIR